MRRVSFYCLTICLACAAIAAQAADKALRINLLSYNTHGLPAFIAQDDPETRFAAIAALTEQYDLILLQEDFAHHQVLLDHLTAPTDVARGTNPAVPPCLICSGSGLTILSNLVDDGWQIDPKFQPFSVCSGVLTGANDCLAQKGFQLVRLTASTGQEIVVVNTHLDAGRGGDDRKARAAQLAHIAYTLETTARGAALIIAGDLNLDWDTPSDRALLTDFSDRLGLTLAVRGDYTDRWAEALDYIYYRSSETLALSVQTSGENLEFENQAGPLSDHPALYTVFGVR